MKKLITLIISAVSCLMTTAQNTLYNNGAVLYTSAGSTVQINGNFTNTNTSTFSNNGTITITGNTTNNQTMSGYTGKLIFNNTSAQQLSGSSSFLTRDFEINNAAGVTLNTGLVADGSCTFVNGIVTAANVSAPFTFTSNATAIGVSNASHVNGFVVKRGTGSFTYPVGDATHYQPVSVDASVNANGIRIQYIAADAGSAPFAGATPLLFYNTREYWNITPLGSATGTVTMYWDSYNNVGISSRDHLRVAHLAGGNWLNEGAVSVTGNASAGSVTSGVISSWSPFTLGSINLASTLPLTWLSLNSLLSAQNQVIINWQVSEQGVSHYNIEKSMNGTSFINLSSISGNGDGKNSYTYTDADVLRGTAYYRIRQTDFDGKHSYSSVMKVSGPQGELLVYPTVFNVGFTVVSAENQLARLTSLDGKVVQTIQLKKGSNYITPAVLTRGVYVLSTDNGIAKKIIKN